MGSADKALDIVLCLNGKTYQTPNRSLMINHETTFSIVDPNGGGQIIGGAEPSVTHSGVIAIINSKATLNIYGGTVEGGTAGTEGRNISVYNKSTATILGGVIVGGGMYTETGSITLGGDAQVETIFLYGGAKLTISVDKPFTGTCGIQVYTVGVFAVSPTDCSGFFATTQGTVSWNSSTKELSVA